MSCNEWSNPYRKSSLTQNASISLFKIQLSNDFFVCVFVLSKRNRCWGAQVLKQKNKCSRRILANFQNEKENWEREKKWVSEKNRNQGS